MSQGNFEVMMMVISDPFYLSIKSLVLLKKKGISAAEKTTDKPILALNIRLT
jgi:hypothetical protein